MIRKLRSLIPPFSVLLVGFSLNAPQVSHGKQQPSPMDLVRDAVQTLIRMQEPGGEWLYDTEDFLGAHVASTAIVGESLLLAAPDDPKAQQAVQRALIYILKRLKNKSMSPNAKQTAGMRHRVWGYAYALEFLCRVRERKAAGEHQKAIDDAIPGLVKALMVSQGSTGGWWYDPTSGGGSGPFVNAPVAQSLLLARAQGEKVPEAIFQNTRRLLEAARSVEGGFAYSGELRQNYGSFIDSVPGSTGRAPISETTLVLLGAGSVDAVWYSVRNFFKYWNELEKHRKGSYTHAPPYLISPYYFCYGHRYVAQAIQLLPEEERAKQTARLFKAILQTRDSDGTWNDWSGTKSKSYGTAMVVLALLGNRTPMPPTLAAALSRKISDKEEPSLPPKAGARR